MHLLIFNIGIQEILLLIVIIGIPLFLGIKLILAIIKWLNRH